MGIIEVHEVHKSYRGRPVLDGIDFSVSEGEVFGILGPNGAGKTTLVEIIAGLRTRDCGEVRVRGLDPAEETTQFRELLAIQPQESRQPAKMTVREALRLYGSFYRHPRSAEELMERLGLTHQAKTRFEHLSGGQQQRLSVALALVGNPQVAILDELTTGLDPQARREIWRFLTELKDDGTTTILVTHSMEEAQHLCDRVAILDAGRFIALDTPAVLAHGGEVVITFNVDSDEAVESLNELTSVLDLRKEASRVILRGTKTSPTDVLGQLMARGVTPTNMQVTVPTLEDAYLALTHGEAAR